MKKIICRSLQSFCYSAVCALIINFLVEIIVQGITGDKSFTPVTSNFLAFFPTATIATEVNALLYGVIGATFSAAMFIYEIDRIGFVIRNIIYFFITSAVWVPIVTLMWQLQNYPKALISTVSSFALTYVIISILGYKITKKDVESINLALRKQNITG